VLCMGGAVRVEVRDSGGAQFRVRRQGSFRRPVAWHRGAHHRAGRDARRRGGRRQAVPKARQVEQLRDRGATMNATYVTDRAVETRLAKRLMDVLIRAGLVLALTFLCYQIFSPFIGLMAWALI